MPIVDARAIQYDQMVNYTNGKPISIAADVSLEEARIQPHDIIKCISITDVGMKRIFENDSDNVCSVVFNDCEPGNIDFIPGPESGFMTDQHAEKIVDFIEKIHALPEKVLVLVNCKFGMCRSGAVVDFIGVTCGLGYWNTRKKNPQIVPNHWNQYLLMREHFKRKFNLKTK